MEEQEKIVNINEAQAAENAQAGAETKKKEPEFDPKEAIQQMRKGKLALLEPIQDGENTYDELEYDFLALKGLELARALDIGGKGRMGRLGSELSDEQALSYFAASAAKCQKQGGLDATDIRERIGGADAITAIQMAQLFFKVSSLAGSSRILKK